MFMVSLVTNIGYIKYDYEASICPGVASWLRFLETRDEADWSGDECPEFQREHSISAYLSCSVSEW